MYQEKSENEMPEGKNIPTLFLMHQVLHMNMQYLIHMMEPLGIKPGHAGILFFLKRTGPLSQREIADRIGVKPPSVTVAIQKLEKLGYIERRPEPRDQRVVKIQITEEGLKCTERMNGIAEHMDSVLFNEMNLEEKLLLRRLMMQMKDNLLDNKEINLKNLCDPCR